MMLLLRLFTAFFKVGLFSFGGGNAMLPLIYQSMREFSQLDESAFSDMVALSQVTPGPVAVNAATFIGLEAIAYGAVASWQMAHGMPPITMRAFDAAVTYDELRAAADALKSGVMESMPKPAKKADAPAAK